MPHWERPLRPRFKAAQQKRLTHTRSFFLNHTHTNTRFPLFQLYNTHTHAYTLTHTLVCLNKHTHTTDISSFPQTHTHTHISDRNTHLHTHTLLLHAVFDFQAFFLIYSQHGIIFLEDSFWGPWTNFYPNLSTLSFWILFLKFSFTILLLKKIENTFFRQKMTLLLMIM